MKDLGEMLIMWLLCQASHNNKGGGVRLLPNPAPQGMPPMPPMPPMADAAPKWPKLNLPTEATFKGKGGKFGGSGASASYPKPTPPFLNFKPAGLMAASVAELQSIMQKNGMVEIKKDGIYGPKTEAGWIELTTRHKLPSAISKVTSKIAKVSIAAFNKLRPKVYIP